MMMKNNTYLNRIKSKTLLLGGVFCLCLVGCKAPNLTYSERMELPDIYEGGDSTSMTIGNLAWEKFFPDTLLQGYIRKALTNNYSFLQTIEQINMARSQVRISKGTLLPEVTLGVDGRIQQFGEYTMDGVGNSTTNTPDLEKSKHIPDPYRDFNLGLNF